MNTNDLYIVIGYNLFIYLLLTVIGWLGNRFPPKEIGFYGYKTPRSIKNLANWKFANALSNKLMVWMAQIYLLTILTLLFFLQNQPLTFHMNIAALVMIILVVVLFIITEYKLKQFEKIQQ